MAIVLVTTLVALLVNAVALLAYEASALRDAHIADFRTQAEILGRASVAAIAFNDRKAASHDLMLLRAREDIDAAAIYDAKGTLFAEYARAGYAEPPRSAAAAGHRIEGDNVALFHPVVEQGEAVGMVYLSGRTGLRDRLLGYLAILGGVIVLALGVSWAFSVWLQRSITAPIQHVAAAARQVVERRDFSVRARKTTEDEIGMLADALNNMLADLEREISERREAEGALKVADRRKDEFLATLAHELRNPLAPIRNALYLLKSAKNDEPAAAEARAIINRQVNQMVRLVDDLLDVSRITTGKLALRRAATDLRDIARNALEATEPLARARQLDLRVDLPSSSAPINADATRLAQVFINLLSNAVKFTDQGGRIAFSAALDGPDVVVSVADTGIGIAPQMLDKLFEIFTQADQSLERSAGGLGVGLWLSRGLVELHGGTLAAKSEGLGRGAQFIVRIPGIALSREPVARDARGAGRAPPPPKRRILLVDDNLDFVNTFAAMLRGLGEDVHVEHDGEAALTAAARLRPEIAFLDIGLPKMNGYDLARSLRRLPETAHSILVAVTGWGQPKDLEAAKDAGFDEHMVKPVDLDRVLGILGRASTRL